ncbi:MAG: Lrp/AsnC family transcriptional regulator [Candidatus Weimeria sp.]
MSENFNPDETADASYTPDETDRKIIDILMQNARMPVKEIAKELYLTSPTVSARIRRLRENGIITGFHTSVNLSSFGYGIKAFVNLEVAPKDKSEFYEFIAKIPNVIECNCVTGDYSMIIEVAFKRTEELDHLINVLQKYGHTKTLIVFSTSVEHRDIPV